MGRARRRQAADHYRRRFLEGEADPQHVTRHNQRSGGLGQAKGEPVEAVARILPKKDTRRVYDAVVKRYWWHAWWFIPHSLIRGGIDKVHIGLEIKPAA